jgi:hypothetical protein
MNTAYRPAEIIRSTEECNTAMTHNHCSYATLRISTQFEYVIRTAYNSFVCLCKHKNSHHQKSNQEVSSLTARPRIGRMICEKVGGIDGRVKIKKDPTRYRAIGFHPRASTFSNITTVRRRRASHGLQNPKRSRQR